MTTNEEGIRIRTFRASDAEAAAALLRIVYPAEVITGSMLLHVRATGSPTARARRWVALRGGDLVGWARAGLVTWTSIRGIGSVELAVHPDLRRRGIGGRLCAVAEAHLLALHPVRLVVDVAEGDGDALEFARRRGYRQTRASRVWTLDPRTVDLSELPVREAAAAAGGFRLAPLRELGDRLPALHRLYAAATLDQPWDVPLDNVPFRRWKRQVVDGPLLDPDGSFVVLHGEEPVSLAWLLVDRERGRAENEMTGTLPAYRHRGLARLAKLATIRWAASAGITSIGSGNDATNTDMLALNEHLDYRPLPGYLELSRPVGARPRRRQARIRSPAGS